MLSSSRAGSARSRSQSYFSIYFLDPTLPKTLPVHRNIRHPQSPAVSLQVQNDQEAKERPSRIKVTCKKAQGSSGTRHALQFVSLVTNTTQFSPTRSLPIHTYLTILFPFTYQKSSVKFFCKILICQNIYLNVYN